MIAGQVYPVSVTMQNTGTTAWSGNRSYGLGSQNPQDNLMWGIKRVTMPSGITAGVISPGYQYKFSFNVTAPASAGTYNFQWKMIQGSTGEWFGSASTNVAIVVTAPPPSGETVTYYHNDVAGTPLVATDLSGKVVWKENYRPYGEKLNNQSANIENKLWFTGKPYDNNTGLSYMGARYYDPLLGRFMGVDPVGFNEDNIHSFNRYAYANNNPYRFIDPDGRDSVDVIKNWWNSSVAGFKSDGIGDTAHKFLAGWPIEGVAVSSIGMVRLLGVETKALGSASFSAANGIGQLYSPNVVLSGSTMIFNDFAVGTARGFMGLGAKGAAELLGPMRQLVEFAQQAGAKQITLSGKYVTEEGAQLGGGKIGETFSYTFDATADGLKSLINQLR